MTETMDGLRKDTLEIMRMAGAYGCENDRSVRQIALVLMNASISTLVLALADTSVEHKTKMLALFREMTDRAFDTAARALTETTRVQ